VTFERDVLEAAGPMLAMSPDDLSQAIQVLARATGHDPGDLILGLADVLTAPGGGGSRA
jgi:hypothetical protein